MQLYFRKTNILVALNQYHIYPLHIQCSDDLLQAGFFSRVIELGYQGHPGGSADDGLFGTGLAQFIRVLAGEIEIEVMMSVLDNGYAQAAGLEQRYQLA